MARRRAEQEARDKFEEEHSASFDDYGRVIRYGTDADKVSCEEKQTAKWKCHVEEYSRRKYLTSRPTSRTVRTAGSSVSVSII